MQIESLAGSRCVLRANFGATKSGARRKLQSEPAGAVQADAKTGNFRIRLAANETVLIWVEGRTRPNPEKEFAPLPIHRKNLSHWGVPGHGRSPPPAPPPPPPPRPHLCVNTSKVDGYWCWANACADDAGTVATQCGTDLCYPVVIPGTKNLCKPLPRHGQNAVKHAAARCNAVEKCHAFAFDPAWQPDGPNQTVAKFFSISNASQLLPSTGWHVWLKPIGPDSRPGVCEALATHLCSDAQHDSDRCFECLGVHEEELRGAGCNRNYRARLCAPWPPEGHAVDQ